MKTKFIIFFLVLSFAASGERSENNQKIFEDALKYFEWLEKHMYYFAACQPKSVNDLFILCDKTKISKTDLKSLFQKKPEELIKTIKEMGIKIEILCDDNKIEKTFSDFCIKKSNRKMFKEIKSLHGKYLPNEKTILIRSSAYLGSLIHEYLHYLQAENMNKLFGKRYKHERIKIQNKLVKVMDEIIAHVEKLKKEKKNDANLKFHLEEFEIASKLMMQFRHWQELIDERALFQLYINYGKEIGVSSKDLEIAKLNMKHICNNKVLKTILPSKQCIVK